MQSENCDNKIDPLPYTVAETGSNINFRLAHVLHKFNPYFDLIQFFCYNNFFPVIQIDHNARTWLLNVNWENSVRAHWMTLEIEQWIAVAYLTHTHYSHFLTTLKSAKCQNICFAEDFSSSRDPRLTSVHEVVVPCDLHCFEQKKIKKRNIKKDIEAILFVCCCLIYVVVFF